MPLSKTNELNLIMNENAKLTVEHSGGDGWTIPTLEGCCGNKEKCEAACGASFAYASL